jgi:hypothetical protein
MVRLALLTALVVAPSAGAAWKPTARIAGTEWLDQVGPGAWVTNTAGGYYLGRAYDGDRVAVIGRSIDPLHLTVAVRPRRHPRRTLCGVVERVALTSTRVSRGANPCRAITRRIAASRRAIGRQFNCPPHVCSSGTYYTRPVENPWVCDGRFYANYLPPGSPYAFSPRGRRGLVDERGPIRHYLHYRFTTRDRRAAVVRDERYGWGVVQRGCVLGHPLGGPPNPFA